jgi:hypothetical protein
VPEEDERREYSTVVSSETFLARPSPSRWSLEAGLEELDMRHDAFAPGGGNRYGRTDRSLGYLVPIGYTLSLSNSIVVVDTMYHGNNRHREEEVASRSGGNHRRSSSSGANEKFSNSRRRHSKNSQIHAMEVDHADDDDDSAMIVYRGDPTPDDMSQPSIPSQSQQNNPLSPVLDVQCMSRSERRKRRFEWRELANRNEAPHSPDDETPVEDVEDAFASLQKLLESQKSQETVEAKNVEKENTKENAMECDPPEEKFESSAPKESTPPHESTTQGSSLGFGPCDDQEDGEGEESQSTMTMQYGEVSDHHKKEQHRKGKSRRTSSPSRTETMRLEKPARKSFHSASSQRNTIQPMSVVLAPSIVGSR